MSIWGKLFGDERLLSRSLGLLAEHGFRPRAEITADHLPGAFRAHPLTTLLTLRDAAGHLLFPRVYVDPDELGRTRATDMIGFLDDVATQAGTADGISHVILMRDPGSVTGGSLRFTLDGRVHDHDIDLDPDYGDDLLEADLIDALSPAGYEAFTFYTGAALVPVTIWLPTDSGDSLSELLLKENPPTPDAADPVE